MTRRAALFLLLAALIVGASGAYHLSRGLTGSQDIYYVQYLGYRWFEPARATEALEKEIRASGEDQAALSLELERRELSARNYPAAAVMSYLGTRLFPGALTRQIAFAQGAAFLLGLLIALLGLARAPAMAAPFAIASGAMALLGFLPGPSPSDHLLYYGPLENALNLVVLAVNPGEAFSPLSFWPKSSLALILMAALANRWTGHIVTGYVLVLATLLFHITLGGLVLAGFVLMDLALRPRAIPWPRLAPVLVLGAAAFSLGQWRIFATSGAFALTLVLLALVALTGLGASRWLAPRVARFPVHVTDTLGFAAAALLLIPLAMALYLAASPDNPWAVESLYLQVAARLVVLAVTVAWLCLASRAMAWIEARGAGLAAVPLVAFACLATVFGAAGSWWWEIRFLDSRLHDPTARATTEPLAPVYYRTLQTLMATGGRA